MNIRKITLAADLAMDAGVTYEVGGPYIPGRPTAVTVERIEKTKGGYRICNDRGGSTFLAEHYVDPASVVYASRRGK